MTMLLEVLAAVLLLEGAAILAVLMLLAVWLRQEVPPPVVNVPLGGAEPGLSLHCGHTGEIAHTNAEGFTACQRCAGFGGR